MANFNHEKSSNTIITTLYDFKTTISFRMEYFLELGHFRSQNFGLEKLTQPDRYYIFKL